MDRTKIGEHEVEQALGEFDSLWETLTPREQERIIHLLVERIDYDGVNGKVAMTFRETGLRSLVQEYAQEELAA